MHRHDVEMQAGCLADLKVLPDIGGDGFHLRVGLLDRHARLQAADHAPDHVVAVRGLVVDPHGGPHVGHAEDVDARWKQNLESGREHADDVRPAAASAEIDGAPDDRRVAAVTTLPQFVADDRDRRQARRRRLSGRLRRTGRRLGLRHGIVLGKVSADRDAGAKQPEHVRRRARDPNLLGLRGVAADRHAIGRGDARQVGERGRVLAHVAIVGRREGPVAHVPRAQLAPDQHEPLGVDVRQRPQQDRVHHAENRRARADAERDRRDSDRREAGILPQHSGGVAEILEEVVHMIALSKARSVPA